MKNLPKEAFQAPHKKNGALLDALDKKIQRLQINPEAVGGMLGGVLHGWHSTRLIRKFRLLFKIDSVNQVVDLGAIDHRDTAYD
ncbi:MAG TPA: hypothetical protein VJH22_00105 [Candidatus Nanoarchaeia archaeon]|nr:hypothetical protein [Candidatus Nanoarchaeia archaeon]